MFTDFGSLRLLRWLKPGFRHCFITVLCDDRWLIYDPLSNQTVVSIIPRVEPECLADWYRRFGCAVVATKTDARAIAKIWIGPYTCVEAVKRILGLRKCSIVTPWQLYRHLLKKHHDVPSFHFET